MFSPVPGCQPCFTLSTILFNSPNLTVFHQRTLLAPGWPVLPGSVSLSQQPTPRFYWQQVASPSPIYSSIPSNHCSFLMALVFHLHFPLSVISNSVPFSSLPLAWHLELIVIVSKSLYSLSSPSVFCCIICCLSVTVLQTNNFEFSLASAIPPLTKRPPRPGMSN